MLPCRRMPSFLFCRSPPRCRTVTDLVTGLSQGCRYGRVTVLRRIGMAKNLQCFRYLGTQRPLPPICTPPPLVTNASPRRRPPPPPALPLPHHPRLLPYFFVISTRTLPSVTSSAASTSTSASVFSSSPSPFSTFSSGATASQSRLLDFLFALAFSSVLLLALSLNAFPLLSLHLLLSRSSTLLSHHHLSHCQPPSPVLWSIGSSDDKSNADRGAGGGGEKVEEGEGEEEGKAEVKVETTEELTAEAGR